MSVSAVKYNPGFLTDDQLAESFCVRGNELESIVETLRECTGASNPHMMVIGPRGSGKTTLLLRTAIEVRCDGELSSRLFPVVFSEESYEIGTCGEFWLECLSHLAEQTPQREGGPDLRRSRDDLRNERDDQRLSALCLGALLDFADREDKRLVLLVENMNMILADIEAHDAWRLRQVLQTEPRIILLASATGRFMQIDQQSEALYDFFRVITLRPLRTGECAALWETVSGHIPDPETVRSMEILTGGNPRLVMIMAHFSARSSLSELMDNLLSLIDDHTEYFKGHLDALPAQERRVYLALAELWKPATTREIAEKARLDTSKCSAQLQRLSERGVVQTAGGSARRKQYYVTERLYNIYYLLRRRRGGLDSMVEALIRFMTSFYSPRKVRDMVARISWQESDGSSLYGAAQKHMTPMMIDFYDRFRAKIKETEIRIFSKNGETSSRETESPMGPDNDENAAVVASRISDIIDKGNAFSASGEFSDALEIYEDVIDKIGEMDGPEIALQIARAFTNKGYALTALDRPEEALSVLDETIRKFGQTDCPIVAGAFMNKGAALLAAGRPEEALSVLDRTVERFGGTEDPFVVQAVAQALACRGVALNDLDRPKEAMDAFDEIIRRFDEEPRAVSAVALALTMKSSAAATMKPDAALAMLEDIIRQFGTNDGRLVSRAVADAFEARGSVHLAMNRPEEALQDFDEAILRAENEPEPSVVGLLTMKSFALIAMGRLEEALGIFEEAAARCSGKNAPFLALALAAKGFAQAATDQMESGLSNLDQAAAMAVEDSFETLVYVSILKSFTLISAGRSEDALTVIDEAIASLKTQETAVPLVAWALVVKGIALIDLDRPKEAQSAFQRAVQMIDGCEEAYLQNCFLRALRERIPPLILEGVEFQLKNRRYEAAANLATVALECANSSVRIKGHSLRAIARCEIGDQASWARDVADMLALLPKINPLPAGCIGALWYLSERGDAATVIDLVEASPSAGLLLPLVTALRRELGQEPRVAREVAEVAQDLQREFSEWRRKLSQANAEDRKAANGD